MTADRKSSAFSSHWRRMRAALLTSTALLPGIVGHQANARNLNSAGSVSPTTAAQLSAGLAAQQAAAAGAQAQASLARAAAALAAARKAQQDAATAAAQAVNTSINGVATGALMPTGGVNVHGGCGDSCTALQLNTPASWTHADTTFTETVKNGQYTVDITQTQTKAILNWETFNVGRNTTVKFEQQSSDWTVLNRITDPSGSPTQILGKISAPGGVYVINRNGIIFGAGAQINVQALVASSLDVGGLGATQAARDQFFLDSGINGPKSFSVAPTLTPFDAGYAAENNRWGDVVVNAGASIATNTVGLDSPGFVYLFGRNVSNAGQITAPAGEVALLAARTIDLVSGGYWKLPSAVLPSNVAYRGTDFQITQFADVYDRGTNPQGMPFSNTYAAGTGLVANNGLIETPRGITEMIGDRISIGPTGVIAADTGITRNSMVLLRAATSIDLEGTIRALAYDDPLTATLPQGGSTGSTVQSYTPAYVELSAQSTVTIGSSGLVSAPSATVALRAIDLNDTLNAKDLYSTDAQGVLQNALFASGIGTAINTYHVSPSITGPQRVLLRPGATIDVAGLQNVELPASYNFIAFTPRGNEFADMPLQRSGALYGETLWIDIRASGTRSDGTSWVGTPVADATGAIGTVGRSLEQLMTTGGSVNLQTDRTSASSTVTDHSVIAQSGSVINVAGGNVTFLPGMVSTTVLIGADGRRYSAANADPNMTYVGIAGQFTVDHAHWKVKETWAPTTQAYQSGYTEGHDAGGITITTVSPQLQGQMYFGSTAGERQIALGLTPTGTGGVASTQAKGDELPSQGYLVLNVPTSVVIGSSPDLAAGQLAVTEQIAPINGVPNPSQFATAKKGPDFTPTSGYQTTLSGAVLSSYGLSLLSITSNDLLVSHNSANGGLGAAGSVPDLSLAAGGKFSATAGSAISIAGDISAAGGQISLVTDAFGASANKASVWFKPANTASGKADIFVEGILDVSGRFVNDTGRSGSAMAGPGYINGGSISLQTNTSNSFAADGSADTTGNILLAQGSVLDASSGGYISSSGAAKMASTGVMAGRGGNISLLLYQGLAFQSRDFPGVPHFPTSGDIAALQLDGTLRAYGFERNGMLTLGAAKTITIDSTARPDANSGIVTSLIGGSTARTAVTLSAAWLNAGGFGSYLIEATPANWGTTLPDKITVASGVNLQLQQQNLASLADYSAVATGSKIGGIAAKTALPDDQRKAVDLTLKSDNILLDTGSAIVTDPQAKVTFGGVPDYTKSDPTREAAAQNVLLLGSVIDHAGTVSVNAQKTWLGSQAKIDVSGTLVSNSRFGLVNGQTTSGTVLAGGTFTVEAAAPNVLDAATGTYVTGAVPSGTYVVAEAGAQVDLSGYAATIQVKSGPRDQGYSFQSWSDAGTVKIDAAAFAWGGTFAAKGGRLSDGTQVLAADGKTPVANGGTIILGGGAMQLQQDSASVTAALSNALAGGPATLANMAGNSAAIVNKLTSASGTSSTMFAAVDRLSAFENVFLYSGTAQNGAARIFTDLGGTTYGIAAPSLNALTISGSVTWTADAGLSRLYIASNAIGSGTPGSTITLAAPYMLLTGGGGKTIGTSNSSLYLGFRRTAAGDTILSQTIDVEGAAFAGFSDVELRSLGDIRLSTPKVADGLTTAGTTTTAATSADLPRFSGQLAAGGANLVLDAQRIYPVSAVDFTIQTTGNVRFEATAGGRSDIPLSAGGSLSVYAATIEQKGNVFAPLGKITFGDDGTATGNTSKVKTTSVTLESGSLTSVTLADTVVPYGETVDGVNWFYNASLHPLQAASDTEPVLPSKGLVLNAGGVSVDKGATIDTRGGGDLQAMEWIQGKGGSRDALSSTPTGQTVYALVPSRNDTVAAFDIHFTTARSLNGGTTVTAGDAYPLIGQQIYLDGSNGIPAGTYTLYSAHYATLPGALRVVDYGSNVGRNIASGTTLPDGTVLESGHYTQSLRPGAYSSGSELFAVQTSAVWRQYSEYSFSTANTYFTDKANHDGVAIPRLPIDAGRIAVIAQQQLLLAGTELAQPATGGRGGELDISSAKLAVLSSSVNQQPFTDAGYVVVASDQLNNFESVLVGGLRSDTAKGTLITGTAADIVVDTPVDPTTQSGGLTMPEVMLVTQPGVKQQIASRTFQTLYNGSWHDSTSQFNASVPAGGGTITIATGSVIATSGTVHTGAGRNYYVAPPNASGYTTAQQVAAAVGGTLDSTGTVITGADINKLPVSIPDIGFTTNPSVPTVANYSYGSAASQSGLGALFVATQDASLKVTGPTGTPQSVPLTIQFTNLAGLSVRSAGGSSGPVTITLPGDNIGRIAVEAGSHITTNSLFMQATATTNNIVLNKPAAGNPSAPAATITANQAKLAGRSIGIGASSSDSLILSQDNLAQLANIKNLTLAATAGDITFYNSGIVQASMQTLTLDARAISGTGVDANIRVGGIVTLLNSSSATGTSAQAGMSGSLSIVATDVVFGGGTQTIAGFSQVNLAAGDRVLFKDQGSLTLGTGSDVVGLQMITPLVAVGGNTSKSGGSFVVATSGAVNIGGAVSGPVSTSSPVDSSDTGGSLMIQGGSVNVGGFADNQGQQRSGTVIQAQAGSITLEATKGDVTLDRNAYLSARGYNKTLVDTTTYLPGGKIVLKADVGNVLTRDASVIDVAQQAGGVGYGGQVQIVATSGRATVLGDLRGNGGNGLGGSILVDTNSLQVDGRGYTPEVVLDPLADKLLAGGFTGAIDVHTRTGDLILSQGHTLKAHSVTLTADDQSWNSSDPTQQFGRLVIAGTIDASGYAGLTADGTGQAGGKVNLYAANEIDLTTTGVINASTAHSDERGGDVTIAVGWGTKSIAGIDLQPGSLIDVHGGTKGGLSGGTLLVRAPNDGGNDVYITEIASTITGARDVTIESFVSFSTNGRGGIDASSLGWNGVLDPGGSVTATSLKVNTVYVPPGSGGAYTQVPDVTFSAPATSATGLKSISIASTSIYYSNYLEKNSSATVVFEAPAGGTAATGIVTTNGDGTPTFVITNPGSGFSGTPTAIRFYRDGVLLARVQTTGSDFGTFDNTAAVGQATGTAVMGLKSIAIASTSNWYHLDPNLSGNVVIQAAGGGVAATGTVTTDANGVPTFTVTSAGSGFTGAPSTILFYRDGKLVLTGHLTSSDFASTIMTVVGVNVTDAGAGYAGAIKANFSGGGLGATQAASVTADMDIGAAAGSGAFAAVTLRQYVQGNFVYHTATDLQHYGFTSAMDRIVRPLADSLGSSVVHLRPGVDLVNPDQTINGGNITVASNWNLAAGTVGNLQAGKYKIQNVFGTTTTTNFSYFDPNASYVDFLYRYLANYGTAAAPQYGVEAGALTLRAVNTINVNASISDGFFQFADYLDSKNNVNSANFGKANGYVEAIQSYLSNGGSSSSRTLDGLYQLNSAAAVPIAPYNTRVSANGISPTSLNLAESDLFPHQLNVCVSHCGPDSAPDVKATITNPGSWSYRLTAGADIASANPNAVQSLDSVGARNAGDVIVNGHSSVANMIVPSSATSTLAVSFNLPTMVRTGTGDIAISAARDVRLADPLAPGVIYSAGVNTAKYANPYAVDASGRITVPAQNVDGFLEPQVMAYSSATTSLNGVLIQAVYGPPTAAAFPTMGGDVSVNAQRDIIGNRNVTVTNGSQTTLWNAYYTPWLLADAGITPATTADTLGAGVFAPNGTASIASQTSWWIQYGSFREGILSAGGNAIVNAGRDLIDVSVSLPTTGRVTGGLAALSSGTISTPQTQLYGSGNMQVSAGRNLLGGSYYEGSGHATIRVAGMVSQHGTLRVAATGTNATVPDYAVLAVDTGQINLVAGGSIAIGGVVNPAELHSQAPSVANLAGGSPLVVNTYGPTSSVSLTAVNGNLNLTMPQTAGTTSWLNAETYPASFTAIAANGDITTQGLVNSLPLNRTNPGIVLAGSQNGRFELLAQGSVDLTGLASNARYNANITVPAISAGPSLLDSAFDPYQPNNGMTGAFSSAVLAHQDDHDSNPALIYAVSGTISAAATTTSNLQFAGSAIVGATPVGYTRVELNRPAKIYAGTDILNLNTIVQNIAPDDVTTIVAGRDILYNYTGLRSGGVALGGPGIQIAGPGFLVVEAGRDLGPFLPLTRDNSSYTQGQEGISSIANASLWPVGNRYVSSGTYDPVLLGAFSASTKKRNELVSGIGADLIVLFGVSNGINYDGYVSTDPVTLQAAYHPGVISTYIDPANASKVVHNYSGELKDFLKRIGKPATTDAAAWSIFQSLPKDLQHVFADQVFFAELKAVGKAQTGTSGQYQRGYEAINTMFPADFGYTQNALNGGANGASVQKHTGDLDMLHASLQTRLGGDISIFGPGGNIRVGSLALEPNNVLKPNDLGILTLGGGAINTFTDASVLVNSSRIMTQQGGDILMWSSNGDLDAGRGAQTTLSFPPLQVVFNSDDYQSVDLGGLVSGAGIAVLQSSKIAKTSNAYLLAPRGTVDAGDAGIRVSGDIVIGAVQVLNSGAISYGGSAKGIPTVTAPNFGALTSASNTAGAATKSAEQPTASGSSDRASVFIVEVVGYGGGDSGDQQSNPSSGNGQGSGGSDDTQNRQSQ